MPALRNTEREEFTFSQLAFGGNEVFGEHIFASQAAMQEVQHAFGYLRVHTVLLPWLKFVTSFL